MTDKDIYEWAREKKEQANTSSQPTDEDLLAVWIYFLEHHFDEMKSEADHYLNTKEMWDEVEQEIAA